MKKLLSLALLLSMVSVTTKAVSISFSTEAGFTVNGSSVLPAFAATGISYARAGGDKEISVETAARFAGRFVVVNAGTEYVDGYAAAAVDHVPLVNRVLGGENNVLRKLLVALAVGEAINGGERACGYLSGKFSEARKARTDALAAAAASQAQNTGDSTSGGNSGPQS
jgi:hypothetical protein